MNSNDVFKKDVTCDNVKSHKKAGLHPLSSLEKNTFLEKGQGWGRGQFDPPPSFFRVKKTHYFYLDILPSFYFLR